MGAVNAISAANMPMALKRIRSMKTDGCEKVILRSTLISNSAIATGLINRLPRTMQC